MGTDAFSLPVTGCFSPVVLFTTGQKKNFRVLERDSSDSGDSVPVTGLGGDMARTPAALRRSGHTKRSSSRGDDGRVDDGLFSWIQTW